MTHELTRRTKEWLERCSKPYIGGCSGMPFDWWENSILLPYLREHDDKVWRDGCMAGRTEDCWSLEKRKEQASFLKKALNLNGNWKCDTIDNAFGIEKEVCEKCGQKID